MTAYEMRISYWSSDVCSSDLRSPLDCRLKRLFELLSILLGRHGKIQNSRSLLQHVRSHPRSERGRFSTRPVRFQRFKSPYEQSGPKTPPRVFALKEWALALLH